VNYHPPFLNSLEDVIEEIQSSCTDFSWYISIENITKLLQISKEDFYRVVYSIRNKKMGFSVSGHGFSREAASDLIQILNFFLKLDAESEFVKAGIYASPVLLKELKIKFQSVILEIAEKHKIDMDLLLLLCSSTLQFDDAFDSYFETKFEMSFIISRTVEAFITEKNIDSSYGIDTFLKKYLQSQLNKHKISFLKITELARDKYYYEVYGKHRQKKIVFIDPNKQKLLDFFGLEQEATKHEVKVRYKQLLKKYHPDVNKNGLEKTKAIIYNYNKLILMMD
jgi:hypothetical protein